MPQTFVSKAAKKRRSQVAKTNKAPKPYSPSIPPPLLCQVTNTLTEAGSSNASGFRLSSTLPVYSYKSYKNPPVVVYTRNEEEANKFVENLRGPLGFDMEWRAFRQNRMTALIQIADDRTILLVQLSGMNRFPSELKRVVESPDILKLGVGVGGDGQRLYRDYGILARGLVDLSSAARDADPTFAAMHKEPDVGLARMVEFYERKHLLKDSVRLSDWERKELTEEQIEYAANDAHCAIQMYRKILEVGEESGGNFNVANHTTDMQHEYRLGKVKMNTLPAVITPQYGDGEGKPTDEELEAYTLWCKGLSFEEICSALGSTDNPLEGATVISYVVRALQADPTLAFTLPKLTALIQEEIGSWSRYGAWIHHLDSGNRAEDNPASTSRSRRKRNKRNKRK